jgi:DSF synthase
MTYFNPATLSRDIMAPASVSGFPQRAYSNLDYVHEEVDRIFWCFLKPQGRPSFTEPLLNDLHDVQQYITMLAARRAGQANASLGWVVLGSHTPNIFSLGGDLTVFSRLIRAGDTEGLRRYAYSCVDISYRNASGYGGDAISVGLAQGDALGGGFESLLSCDVLVAERRARFGLPEVLMNLFPGMGAHAFLTRRLGSGPAMKMILSGEVFSAQAMYDMGIVDVLAEDGNGEAAVRDYIQRNESRHHAHAAIFRARRRVSPVSLQELRDVTDIWVETAMALTERDLRRIQHLVSAQDRSRKVQPQGLMVAAE